MQPTRRQQHTHAELPEPQKAVQPTQDPGNEEYRQENENVVCTTP